MPLNLRRRKLFFKSASRAAAESRETHCTDSLPGCGNQQLTYSAGRNGVGDPCTSAAARVGVPGSYQVPQPLAHRAGCLNQTCIVHRHGNRLTAADAGPKPVNAPGFGILPGRNSHDALERSVANENC